MIKFLLESSSALYCQLDDRYNNAYVSMKVKKFQPFEKSHLILIIALISDLNIVGVEKLCRPAEGL